MEISKTCIQIHGALQHNSLSIRCICNDELKMYEKKITGLDTGKHDVQTYLMWWLLNRIKPLLLKLPVQDIDLDLTQDCKEKFGNLFDFCLNCLKNTNEALKQYPSEKDKHGSNTNTLFFNVDENPNFNKVYQKSHDLDPGKTRYKNMNSGFNAVERKWEQTPPPMMLDEFVNYIQENKIKKIVSINHYLLEKYMEHGVYILSFFKYLGIEYIIVDLDNYDLSIQGYLFKQFYNVKAFQRFSYAQFHVVWDKYYEMTNTNRIAMIHKGRENFEFTTLADDYVIAVTSNSRINDVISMLNPIVFILSHFKEDSFFEEFELWYYSLRHLILNVMDLNEYERLYYNALLLKFAYAALQFLKYDVIDSIESSRKIEVYGDIGWQALFPDLYVSYLDQQGMTDLFKNGRAMNLLMNWQLTWFETSAAIFNALNHRVPFLNHPALVKTDKLKGMSSFEYHNPSDLNQKLDNMNDCVNPELIRSIEYLNRFCNKNLEFMSAVLLSSKTLDHNNKEVISEFEKHDALLSKEINSYCFKNEPFLRYSFKSLFVESIQYDLNKSRYFSKNYMQRMLHYAQNAKA